MADEEKNILAETLQFAKLSDEEIEQFKEMLKEKD